MMIPIRFFLALFFILLWEIDHLKANTTDKISILPHLSSQQKPSVGKKAADAYIRSTQNTPHRYKKKSYSIGIYFSHFTSSTAYQSPFSPQQQGFSSGLTYLQKISSEHVLFRGDLSLEKSKNNTWHTSLTPSFLLSYMPIYVGVGIPSLNLTFPNNTFYMDWQLLTGIRLFEVLNFLNFFIEAKWKNPFNIFDTSQRKTMHLLAGILLLF